MLDKVLELKERYVNATTEQEYEQIDKEMQSLMNEDPDTWALAMIESAKLTADKAENLVKRERIREQLDEILPVLPLSYIAKNYFNKSRQWLYQRINGHLVNGKPAQFTNEDIHIFNEAIQDLSKKLGSIRIL